MKILIVLILISFTTRSNSQDHSEFIEGPFETPQEVTETCLMCHEEAAEQIMQTRHWNWIGTSNLDSINLGKKNMINNFCIAVPSNWPRCTSCHISYGWKDETFDFSNPLNVDCLVCHEQTGTYKKSPAGAGIPEDTVDLVMVAQSVGKSSRQNCGTCHFDGGGGTGVKHGDMDNSLYEPDYETDVHMGGMDFQCTDCHETTDHKIAGASHGSLAAGENLISCVNCHGEEVHSKELLNRHTKTVACETCHIPSFARVEPTVIWWDWSKAGEERETETNEFGKKNYDKKKGEFVWAKNIKPEYFWFNGKATYYTLGDKVNPGEVLQLNRMNGSISDPDSKIAPFKVMRGRQPYDPVNNYLIIPKLYGENGYWKTFDWVKASEEGMKQIDLDFSGEVDFIETEMLWPLNHMVAPSDQALKCTSCHGIKGEHYLDWKKLGYKDDPMKTGTREENNLIKK